MKRNIIFGIVAVIIFAVGFLAGMEYKAYQVRSAIQDAFSGNTNTTETTNTNQTVMDQAEEEKVKEVEKKIGDELVMDTGTLKVNSAKEQQTLTAQYSSPKVAKAGTKFIVVNLDVKNTTKSAFSFPPDDVFVLVDNNGREFRTYSESIGAIDDYLNYRDLSPGVIETGNLVYEVPSDVERYSLITRKASTNELFKIVLK